MKEIRIAVVGCGTVGMGLIKLIADKRQHLAEKYGCEIKIVVISDYIKGSIVAPDGVDPRAAHDALAQGSLMSIAGATDERPSLSSLLSKTRVDFVCDMTPTNYLTGQPSLGILQTALSSGVNAVTCSKGGVGKDLAGLRALARDRGVVIRYESSVLSGTPLINMVRGPLAGCEISKAAGIVNGTTNYILTMMEEGMSYADALAEAQRLGYAETDPTGDVEGSDAAVKVCILSETIFGAKMSFDDVERIGITGVTNDDIARARANGRRVKLIACAERTSDGVKGSVRPTEIDERHPLAGVGGATNAVSLTTDSLGEITIIGPGAGARETAHGILSDILDVVGASR